MLRKALKISRLPAFASREVPRFPSGLIWHTSTGTCRYDWCGSLEICLQMELN